MQSINVAVLNPRFLGTFLGTAAACILLAVSSLLTCCALLGACHQSLIDKAAGAARIIHVTG
jgi:uncharacterized membrane protein